MRWETYGAFLFLGHADGRSLRSGQSVAGNRGERRFARSRDWVGQSRPLSIDHAMPAHRFRPAIRQSKGRASATGFNE